MTDAPEFADKPSSPAERRQHSRQQLRSIAYVELDEGNGGIVLNVSEGGLSVQAVVSLMDDRLPRMRIQLPQPNDWVEAGARIAWTGKSRKVVGLEFVDLPEKARGLIREWISQENLPAPFPSELKAEPHEDESVGLAADASEPANPEVEPVVVAPAPEDLAQNAATTTGGDAIPLVTQAEEATPTEDAAVTPAPVPTPMPTSERMPPALASPALPATPRPMDQPAGQAVAEAFDQSRFVGLKLTGQSAGPISQPPRQVTSHASLAMLITMLALVSLATGWAAGRGAFNGILAKVHAMASGKSAEVPNLEASSAAPIVPDYERQDTNAKKLRSAVTSSAPTPTTKQMTQGNMAANQAPQPQGERMAFQAAYSTPTVHRAGYADSSDEGVPLRAGDLRGPASISPLAGPMNPAGSIPPPQVEPQRTVLKPAELIHRVDPVYPTIAREQRIEGTVKLHVKIGLDGTVQNVETLSGPPLLTKAAVSAVRQWRYRPMMLNGAPVEADYEVNMVFKLSASSQ